MSEDEFFLRPGRIGARGGARGGAGPRTFIGVALVAARRAGGQQRRGPVSTSTFGRGRAASLRARQGLGPRGRGAVIKARVVRRGGRGGGLSVHIDYLQREGVTETGERGRLFDAQGEAADGKAFAERCADDRHHFRFIVSPDDADQLADLKAYTRDLMGQAERDLGGRLDWVAVDHWNTGHPHIHVLVRGRGEDGADLVISRDYIREGLRARASQLVTLELGPRTEADLRRAWDQQVGADHWTSLDRSLTAQISEADGLVDLRPPVLGRPDALRVAQIARVRRLETLGLAEEVRAGRWRLDPEAQATLKAIGQSRDIIARINRALGPTVQTRDPSSFVVEASPGQGLVGRLAGRGLHDELTGAGYVVVDGLDGRVHHVRGADLDQAAELNPGAIVELQAVDGGRGLRSVRLVVRSDLDLAAQVQAQGATWLDRQLVGPRPAGLGLGGFADDVRQALSDRIDHLESQGLARRRNGQVIFARDLLATLKDRELASTISRLEQASGLTHQPLTGDDPVAGVYRQRLNLASGRFAMIETGLGFSLVPWRPDMDRHLGREITGVPTPGGGMTWSPGHRRGLTR
ncbi:MAG: type VI secretion protein [Alphaproteobacteria bacterium PA2]|nr:MAG: type VI secretion protein [Alphaproteobacteria bacterium PA2]